MVPPGSSRTSLSSAIVTLKVLALLISCHPKAVHADDYDNEKKFCPDDAIVDLTYATKNASGFLTHDESGHSFPPWAIRNSTAGVRQGCICDLKQCLPLCSVENGTRTGRTQVAQGSGVLTRGFVTQGSEERFFFQNPCPGRNASFLEPGKYESDQLYLLANGWLFLPRRDDPKCPKTRFKKYCLRRRGNDFSCTPKVCPSEAKRDHFAVAKYVGCLVSVPFLVATVIVYSVLPELRNLYGRTLICHQCCLIVSFVALAAVRIPQPHSNICSTVCLCLGFTIYASFVAGFFWLNVMCFDMWWTFGGFGTLNSNGVQQKNKKFIRYSIYAWGIPVVLTAICIGMEFSPTIPESLIRPGFRVSAGWFSTKKAEALYFCGPLGVTIICNIGFFISTSITIVRQNKDTKRELDNGDRRRDDDKKQRFNLHLKLFVVMGISWSTEIISWLWEGPKYVWYFTDMANALMGILIFVIFVCKRNVWCSLRERYDNRKLRLPNFQLNGCICISQNTGDLSAIVVYDHL